MSGIPCDFTIPLYCINSPCQASSIVVPLCSLVHAYLCQLSFVYHRSALLYIHLHVKDPCDITTPLSHISIHVKYPCGIPFCFHMRSSRQASFATPFSPHTCSSCQESIVISPLRSLIYSSIMGILCNINICSLIHTLHAGYLRNDLLHSPATHPAASSGPTVFSATKSPSTSCQRSARTQARRCLQHGGGESLVALSPPKPAKDCREAPPTRPRLSS